MSAHYRSPLSYTVLLLESASDSIFYIFQTLQDCEDALSLFEDGSLKEGAGQNSKVFGITADAKKCINTHRDEFETKMSHDLSTSHILTGAFQDALKFIKSSISMLKKKLQKQQQLSLIQSLTEIKKEVKLVLNILGLIFGDSWHFW